MIHLRLLLLLALTASLAAQTASELLAEIDAGLKNEVLAPGSSKRAELIAELIAEDLGLPLAETQALRLALAESWLDAERTDTCQTVAAALIADAAVADAVREAAALLWIGAWQVAVKRSEDPDTLPAPLAQAWPVGDAPLTVAVRALTAEAHRHIVRERYADALAAYDRALVLLKDRPADERVPVYVLRLMAMELPEPDPVAIQAWLDQHRSDPALAQVASSALTAGQQLIGQPAPPLRVKRIDGQEGEIDLGKHRGSVVVLDFMASWCQPCVVQAPAIAAVLRQYQPKGVVALGISLDTRETQGNLQGFLNRAAIDYPVGGDLLGWDGELDDAFHVDGIPALIVVDAEGRITAVDLIAADPAETGKRLAEAIEAALAAGKDAGPAMEGALP